jgi:hypothetical protein
MVLDGFLMPRILNASYNGARSGKAPPSSSLCPLLYIHFITSLARQVGLVLVFGCCILLPSSIHRAFLLTSRSLNGTYRLVLESFDNIPWLQTTPVEEINMGNAV